jgi:hypothetical protein
VRVVCVWRGWKRGSASQSTPPARLTLAASVSHQFWLRGPAVGAGLPPQRKPLPGGALSHLALVCGKCSQNSSFSRSGTLKESSVRPSSAATSSNSAGVIFSSRWASSRPRVVLRGCVAAYCWGPPCARHAGDARTDRRSRARIPRRVNLSRPAELLPPEPDDSLAPSEAPCARSCRLEASSWPCSRPVSLAASAAAEATSRPRSTASPAVS